MNDANPFQSPVSTTRKVVVAETDWASQPDRRITFSIALNEHDIKGYLSNGLFKVLLAILPLLLIIVLLFLAGFALTFPLLLVVCIFVGVFASIRMRLNWKYAIRQTPRLLEPTTGYINSDGLFTSSKGCQGYSSWDDIFAIRTTSKCMLLSGESWRLVSLIVPWTAFENPDAATQAVESVVQQRKNSKPVMFGDERLTQEPVDVTMFQPSGRHVSYQGEITFGQIAQSEPGKKIKSATFKFFLVIIATFLLGCLAAFGGLNWIVFISLPALVFSIMLSILLFRQSVAYKQTELVAFHSQGWFCESGFALQASTGQSYREWTAIDSIWHDAAMLCVRLPGISDGWFFIARTQFANSEDFAQACKWSEAGLARSTIQPQIVDT